ncbi:MAG: HAD-IIB family hydrolase [Smithella sp.]
MIVCDIDGCLTPGKGKSLNLGALAAVRHFNCESKIQKNVPPITLCSGRSLSYVEAMMHAIDGYLPAISENGAVLYYPIEDDYRLNPLITPQIPQIKKQMAFVKNVIHKEIIDPFKARFECGKEFVISINPPPDVLIENFFKIVQDCLIEQRIDMNITHSAGAIDITPPGIDKFSGLQILLETLEIVPADVAGIGDTSGDFPVLKKVGFSAAPANATSEVKQIVDYVSDFENGNGVIDIIKHCILLNQS